MRIRKAIIPLNLLLLGGVLLVGCIYIPYVGSTGQQTAKAGDEVTLLGGIPTQTLFQGQYQHHFKIGVSTRNQVLGEMLTPASSESGGRSIRYWQSKTGGYWVYPLCFFYAASDQNEYSMTLNFDDRGVLVSTTRHDLKLN